MIREQFIKRGIEGDKDFRWRGGEVSRIEALSDAVFAIAIALLVVSLEVPKTFEQLVQTMQGFAAFAITLTAVISIWYGHYIYFRRFGFEDGITIVLNTALLFVVLFYIYPLKFLATLLITYGLLKGFLGFNIVVDIAMPNAEWATLMIVYSIGFIAVFAIFMLLYLHAYRQREALDLNPVEAYLTKASISSYGILTFFGVVSVFLASLNFSFAPIMAGLIYWLVGPVMGIAGSRVRKKVAVLKEEMTQE